MKEISSSLIRHVLTTAGGSLVAKGLITATLLDQVVGSVIVLAGVAWSLVSKIVAKKTGVDLNATPSDTPETK